MVTISFTEQDADVLANILAAVANGNYETENEALIEAADRLLDLVCKELN